MTDALVPAGDGHTELPEDDRRGLIPSYIATRGDLLDAEQRNVARALLRSAPSPAQLLDDKYLRELHGAMFGDVWRWAGHYRKTERNIGIAPSGIAVGVVDLIRDAQAWIDYDNADPDELAVRLHHRLVAIHPFSNGNGRHGRIVGDYLVTGLGRQPFSWGRNVDTDTDGLRAAYLSALRRADAGDIAELVEFARG